MQTYTFSEEEARAAYDDWGCNCGPTALAFALQTTLEEVRPAIPEFDARRYTSPTMMAAALETLGRSFKALSAQQRGGQNRERIYQAMFSGQMTLVRIQWTGPWIIEGKPQRWAGRQTHWIACWKWRTLPFVFDVNAGMQGFGDWQTLTVPRILETIKRSDGGWYPANVWRLLKT